MNVPEAETDFTPYVSDNMYLNMDFAKPRDGDGPDFSKVTKRLKEKDGLTIGRSNNNPIPYTRMYQLEYKCGHKASLSANAIEEKKNFKSM